MVAGGLACSGLPGLAWLLGLLLLIAFQFVSLAQATSGSKADPWDRLELILEEAVADGAFPGAVATVYDFRADKALYHRATGSYTYGEAAPVNGNNPRVTVDTVYDMASLTKVLVSTTAAAQLYQDGKLPLDVSLCDPALLGPLFCQRHPEKRLITVRHLMLHNSGFAADPIPGYFEKRFGCPESSSAFPRQVFTCQRQIHAELATQGLRDRPGARYVYSDLSMMTLMFLVGKIAREHRLVTYQDLDLECAAGFAAAHAFQFGRRQGKIAEEREHDDSDSFMTNTNTTRINTKTKQQASLSAFAEAAAIENSLAVDQCYFEAYARRYVAEPVFTRSNQDPELHRRSFTFRPRIQFWSGIAPTEKDTWYTNRVLQGQVHDSNAYACGGFQGHAGLFASSMNATTVLGWWLDPERGMLRPETVREWITVADKDFSSRSLGWDTNSETPTRPHGTSHCGTLSPRTFMHTGYTGTMVCADPDRGLGVVLLTNRVYPTRENTKISGVRNRFARAVQEIFDAQQQQQQ